VLSSGGLSDQTEVIFWPSIGDTDFSLRVADPGAELRVTTVYEVSGRSWSRVERWTENSGFRIDRVSPHRRRYHSNYYAVSPPTFDDMVFEVQVLSVG
jgi:hypothetical protein